MKLWKWLAACSALWGMTVHAGDSITSLCAQKVEGSFAATVAPLGRIHLNLFCLDANTMLGTLGVLTPKGIADLIGVTNFSHALVVDGQLQLTDFDPSDPTGGSSKGQTSILHADIAQLKTGKLHGDYMRSTMPTPITLEAVRTQTYVDFAPSPIPISLASIAGVYKIADAVGGPDKMIIDYADDMPVIYYDPRKMGDTLHLLKSDAWDGSGLLSISTPEGNGGEGDDAYMFYLRGHVLADGTIEFYLYSPSQGALGPMHAVKTSGL